MQETMSTNTTGGISS